MQLVTIKAYDTSASSHQNINLNIDAILYTVDYNIEGFTGIKLINGMDLLIETEEYEKKIGSL